jgi:hypothetical protein
MRMGTSPGAMVRPSEVEAAPVGAVGSPAAAGAHCASILAADEGRSCLAQAAPVNPHEQHPYTPTTSRGKALHA